MTLTLTLTLTLTSTRYEATYRGLAEEGLRVLALAYKRCEGDVADVGEM